MAVRTLKTRFEFDGEKEYKAALADLNSGNRVLASEMKKLKAEYQGNAESTEFLTKKGELLEREILQQKDKVEVLRKAVEASAAEFGEASDKTDAYKVKLNNAEAQLYDLEHALDENNAALQGENNTMVGLGDTVDQLAGKLGINIPDGAKKALNGMTGLSSGTVAAMASAAAGVATLIKAVSELHQLTLEAAAGVDEVVTESMITGLATDTIQQFKYAENLIDVSYSTITGSLTKLTSAMADAKDGNADLAAQFETLGVSITDAATGGLRDAEDVFYDVVDALGQVGNQTERDAIAMELMGKSAQDLNPLILQGSDALRELAAEAEETGYVLDESQIAKLAAVDDEYQRLQLQIEATKKELAVEFAPASQTAMELFRDVVKVAGDALVDSGLIKNLASIISSVLSIVDAGTSLMDALPGWLNPLHTVTSAFEGLAYILATVADAVNVVAGLLPWNWGSGMTTTALGWNIGEGQMSNLQKLKYSGGVSYNASGNDNWRGGLTYINENGPEEVILPSGTKILNAQDTRSLGGDTFYITIDAASVREFNEIVEMAKSERVRRRMA